MTSANPMKGAKWQMVHAELLAENETIAVEIYPDGTRAWFMPKLGYSVDGRCIKAMLSRGLLRPCGIQIDPEVPQAYEPVREASA